MKFIALITFWASVALPILAETPPRLKSTPGAPILVIDAARLQAIVRQLARREPIELLLGQGIEDGNGVTYILKLPKELPDGKTPVVEGIQIIYKDGVAEVVQYFLTGFPDTPWTSYKQLKNRAEQGGAGQPATASESKSEGDEKPKPQSEPAPPVAGVRP